MVRFRPLVTDLCSSDIYSNKFVGIWHFQNDRCPFGNFFVTRRIPLFMEILNDIPTSIFLRCRNERCYPVCAVTWPHGHPVSCKIRWSNHKWVWFVNEWEPETYHLGFKMLEWHVVRIRTMRPFRLRFGIEWGSNSRNTRAFIILVLFLGLRGALASTLLINLKLGNFSSTRICLQSKDWLPKE